MKERCPADESISDFSTNESFTPYQDISIIKKHDKQYLIQSWQTTDRKR